MQKTHDWAQYYAYISNCAHRNDIMSSKALAEKAEVGESIISRIKSGDSKSPTFDTIYALCNAAGASIDVMCGLKSETTEELMQEKEKNEHLIAENNDLHHKIEMLNVQLESMSERAAQTEERREATQRIARMRLRFIIGLTIGLSAVLLLVIGILIYDKLNPDVGWFTAFQNAPDMLKNII